MVNIYYGREIIDKEKFMYDTISQSGCETLIIVPDQYTLEGEKQAFKYLGKESLIGVEIVSMSRLGFKLLEELGGAKENFIDKYGRHMVLSSIINKEEKNLQVFKGNLAKESFVELLNNFISEMKQYDVSPEDLEEIFGPIDEGSLLKKKLQDLTYVYSLYEEAICGKYTDSEDYVNLYIDKISQSETIKNSNIWIYGFESFAPKALKMIEQLMAHSKQVNVSVTYDKMCRDEDLFKLAEMVIANLKKCASNVGMSSKVTKIEESYEYDNKTDAIKAIESELYSIGKKPCSNCQGLTIVKAANMYNEAESAASFILYLLREKKLRYSDIVVICNDQKVRSSILRRVFHEYGLDFFADKKRGILNSPIVIFLISLLEIIVEGYRTPDIFKFLKTGFLSMDDEDIEKLENYSIEYRIKGSMWKKNFPKGESEYGSDGLEHINELREQTLNFILPLEKVFEESKTMESFVSGFYDYVVDKLKLTEQLESFICQQREIGLEDSADETMQVWSQVCGILDQIVALVGEEDFNSKDFIYLFKSGLDQVEVGILPPTVDDILVGTMQRTRAGEVKAMIVVGANEGIIPADASGDQLFTREEMDFLADKGDGICKSDKIRNLEEQLAIYRNLSKPTDYLWISFSASDEDGKEIRSSEIINSLCKIFPDLELTSDVLNRESPEDLIGGRLNTLRHLTENLALAQKGEEIDPLWKGALQWFRENDKESLEKISKGFDFTNKQMNLPVRLVNDLFKKDGKKDLSLSASRLEKFSRCPFSHFITYGLRPEERRIFEASGREIGDIYHRCLMELSELLTEENLWDTITESECRDLVVEITRKRAKGYRDGLFEFSNEEKYKTARIEEACFYVCWSLIEQVRAGKIKESQYEVAFGRGRKIKPIEINLGEEQVFIEGKIDRLDILENDRVKIIDYKTGRDQFDLDEAKAGYRLQLMLYLKAAKEGVRKPAGVFYFKIGDPRIDLGKIKTEDISEKISKEIRKSFKLDGIIVDESSVIDQIAGDFGGYSEIVPLFKKKNGTVTGTSENKLLSEDDFSQLENIVDEKVKELCTELTQGRIEIMPKKSGDVTPCDYCQLKGICRFDTGFSGCSYEKIK